MANPVNLKQICNSSNMDKQEETMEEISIPPSVPFNDTETINKVYTPLAGPIDDDDDDDDDWLMEYDDLLENNDVTHIFAPSISEDEMSSFSDDWYAQSDSDTSEIVSLFEQNVNEEIRAASQRFLFSESSKDDLEEDTNTAMAKAAEMLVFEVNDKDVKTLQSTKAVSEKEEDLQVIWSEESPKPTSSSSTLNNTSVEMFVSEVTDETVKTAQSHQDVKSQQSAEAMLDEEEVQVIRLEDSPRPTSSSSTTSTQAAEMLAFDVTDEAVLEDSEAITALPYSEEVQALEDTVVVCLLQPSEAVKTEQSTEDVETLQSSFTEDVTAEVSDEVEAVETEQSQGHFGQWRTTKIYPASLTHLDEAMGSVSTDLTSKSKPGSFRYAVSPLPSTSMSSPNYKVTETKTPVNLFLCKPDSECPKTNPASNTLAKTNHFVKLFQNFCKAFRSRD